MKKIILFTIFILVMSNISGDPINTYETVLIKTIQIGHKDGQLMFDKNVMPSGPIAFTISKNNIIYVGDTLNGRLVLFDLNFNFIKNTSYAFKENNFPFLPDVIKIDEKDNIILYGHLYGFLKIDNSGVKKYYIDFKKYNLIIGGCSNYFSIDDYIFYYDDKENIKVIDKDGTIKDDTAGKEIVKGYALAASTRAGNTADNQKLNDFTEKNNLLMINNEILTTDYQKYEKIKKFYKTNKPQTKGVSLKNNVDLDSINPETLLGVDVNQNQYWQGILIENSNIPLIVVFSKDGDVVDCFYTPHWMIPALSPNGDIYLMYNKEDTGIPFYKITRRW